jgi:ABC-type amino acid transport substrate-binding protein
MLVKVEFHFDCARRSVRRFQTVVVGASIDFLTAIASRNVVRVVVAFQSWDSSAIAVTR